MCYLEEGQPHVLAAGEAMQHQQRWSGAPWRTAGGITEAVTSTVRVADHQPQPESYKPAEDYSRITGRPACLSLGGQDVYHWDVEEGAELCRKLLSSEI